MAELAIPGIVGRFPEFEIKSRLLPTGKVLGRGQVASVVEVEWNGTLCAAKEFHFDDCEQKRGEGRPLEEFTANYLKECQTWFSLTSSHIVQVLGVCIRNAAELPVVVMEKMDSSLQDYLGSRAEESVPLCDKICILRQLAESVAYLHTREPLLVHGDLRPTNVLLCVSQSALVVKVCDFGLSRVMRKSGLLPESLTKTTRAYAPPEKLLSHVVDDNFDPKCDIFSFGSIVLFTLTHKCPEPIQLTGASCDDKGTVSELQRREKYLSMFGSIERHLFFDTVRSCLENKPSQRLSSLQLVQQLVAVEKEYLRHLPKSTNSLLGGTKQEQQQLQTVARHTSEQFRQVPHGRGGSCSVKTRTTVPHHRKIPPHLNPIFPLQPPLDKSCPDWGGAKCSKVLTAPSPYDLCSAIAIEGDQVAIGLTDALVLYDRRTGSRTHHFGVGRFGGCVSGVAFLGKQNLVASDTRNGNVKLFTTKGTFVRAIDRGIRQGFRPRGIAAGPGGLIYVCDDFSQSICVFTAEGKFMKSIGTESQSDRRFVEFPRDICFTDDGCMYITDASRGKVLVFDGNERFLRSFTTTWLPSCIAPTPCGHLIVTSWISGKLMVYSSNGVHVYTYTRIPQTTPTSPRIVFPKDVAVDCEGLIYMASGVDECTAVVLKV